MLAAVVAMLRVVVRDRETERIVAETVERIDRSKRGYQIAFLPGDDPTTDGQRRRGQTVGKYYADQMGEVDMSPSPMTWRRSSPACRNCTARAPGSARSRPR